MNVNNQETTMNNNDKFDTELKLLVDCLLNKYSKLEIESMVLKYLSDLQENDTKADPIVNVIDFMYKRYEPVEDICGDDIADSILHLIKD
jgi:hypothetical protein